MGEPRGEDIRGDPMLFPCTGVDPAPLTRIGIDVEAPLCPDERILSWCVPTGGEERDLLGGP